MFFQPNEHNSRDESEFAVPEWVTSVREMLSLSIDRKGQAISIDFAELEKRLARIDISNIYPEPHPSLSAFIEKHLFVTSLPSIDGQDNPDPYYTENIDESRVIDRYQVYRHILTPTTCRFFSETFSHERCALLIGPSLVKPLIFSCGESDECEINSNILELLESRLSPEGFRGVIIELNRHLLLKYVGNGQVDTFDRYAEVLIDVKSRHTADYLRREELPLESDAKSFFFNMLLSNLSPPAKTAAILNHIGAENFLATFDVDMLSDWFERGFRSLTDGFQQIERDLEASVTYKNPPPRLSRLENVAQIRSNRFSALLDMLIYAHSSSASFRNAHSEPQNEGTLEETQNRGMTGEGTPASNDDDLYNTSRLPKVFVDSVAAMLNILGHGDLPVPLGHRIPCRIAEIRELFGWFLDDIDEGIYKKSINSCFQRLISSHEYTSASVLTVIAPSCTDPKTGGLRIASEFQDLIEENQDFICNSIVEQIHLVADLAHGYQRAPLTSTRGNREKDLCRDLFEDGFRELKTGISNFLTTSNLRGYGDQKFCEALTRLAGQLICLEPLPESNSEIATTHLGFTLSLNLFNSLLPQGKTLVGDIMTAVFNAMPELRREFVGYLSSCEKLAANLNAQYRREAGSHKPARNILEDPNLVFEISQYERRIGNAVTFFNLLPRSDQAQITQPKECLALLEKMRRGRELRRLLESEPNQVEAIPVILMEDVQRRSRMTESHDEKDKSSTASLAASFIELYQNGKVSHSREAREELISSLEKLGHHYFSRLTDPSEYFAPESVKVMIFHAESYYLGAFRIGLQGANPPIIAQSAKNLHLLYSWTAEHTEYRDDPQSKFHRLAFHFNALGRKVSDLSREDTPSAKEEISALLHDFIESYDTERLVRETYLNW